jgi:YebC/PmpR family DNA-binding regulatory protein
MSGHNKWSKVKHKKEASDAKKSKIFSKLAYMIAFESKRAAGNVTSPSLRAAIEKARAENMPQENIERAIKRGTGADAGAMEEVTYEAYGPGGCALVISGLTDNKNRAAAEVKHVLSEKGFALAGMGSALWAFKKTDGVWSPTSTLPLSDADKETLATLIDEIEELDDVQSVATNADFS